MTEKAIPSKDTTAQAGRKEGNRKKKPYEPPRLVSRHVMEVVTGVCTPPTGKAEGACVIGSS